MRLKGFELALGSKPCYNNHMDKSTKGCERPGCSKEISGSEYEVRIRKYCSRSCAAQVNNRVAKKRSVEGTCKGCGGAISTRYTYCSSECRGWELGPGASEGSVQRVYVYSPECGVCKEEKPRGKGLKYCSKECRIVARDRSRAATRLDKVNRWLSGAIDACMKYSLSDWAREYVLEQAGYQCEAIDERTGVRCTENRRRSNGSTVLQVDHIDGDWQNCVRENLRALCPTCHALTPTWGAGNMGRGRTWKKDYSQYAPKG